MLFFVKHQMNTQLMKEITKECGITLTLEEGKADYCIQAEQKGTGYEGIKNGKDIQIYYETIPQFCRCFSRVIAHCQKEWSTNKEKESFKISNPLSIGKHGVMYDCSRNGVMNVNTIKKQIRYNALMGLNQLLLYTEDTYEIKEFPYFGSMRGRYTKDEIRECQAYANLFGVELVPCVQTLAHLRTMLRWPVMEVYRDDDDILMVGEESTYQLIEAMIKNLREMFETDRIHVGMDEAFFLGLGNYRKKNGYVPQNDLMKQHLSRVLAICKTYHFKPMVWSDMFFTDKGDGSCYDVSDDATWEEGDKIDEDVTLVYWDYYSKDKNKYKKRVEYHKKLTSNIAFAGGGWTWNGVTPNYTQAILATQVSIPVMREEKIPQTIYTLWMDNGAETPLMTANPMIAFYSNQVYGEMMEGEEMEQWFYTICKESYHNMLRIEQLDRLTGTKGENEEFSNPSKGIFYQDPLVGMFDKQYAHMGLKEFYSKIGQEFGELKENSVYYKDLYEYYELLAKVDSVKSQLGTDLKIAYETQNEQQLKELIDEMKQIIPFIEKMKQLRKKIWFEEYKPNGYEVLDIRFAGIIARLQSTIERVELYLNKEIQKIEELEEERLYYMPPKDGKPVIPNCNLWEYIVSASNIKSV